ncbi:MAG: hypothetical protein GXO43_07630 [Crenarchaeota archaeon]|nr:hypothetical protein [Thermoproteota archaeon]
MSVKKLIHYIVEYGRMLILAVDIVIIAVMSILIGLTTVIIVRDIIGVWNYQAVSIGELQITVNDVFLLIVFAEIIRSIIVGRRQPEMYLVAIAEVGFVISIREVIASVVRGSKFDILYASISSLILAVVLLLMYRYVLPHRGSIRKSSSSHSS